SKLRIILVLCGIALLAGCGGGGKSDVVASFYPLAFAAQTIGGPGLHVRNLTPSGAEPHDIELTPSDVAAVQKARLVIYLSHDFQPAVEQAVGDAQGVRLDAVQGLSLARGVGDESGKADPHVWLDPVLFERVVRRIGAALHRPRATAALVAQLATVDRQYRA